MVTKKYELLSVEKFTYSDPIAKRSFDVKAHRIKALIDIPRHGVRAGDIGGYVKNEYSLSQEGDAWIAENAYVHMDTYAFRKKVTSVTGHALVSGNAIVFNSRVDQAAIVTGRAYVQESVVRGSSVVEDYTTVLNSEILDHSHVWEKAFIRRSLLEEKSDVSGESVIGSSKMSGNSKVLHNSVVSSSTLKDDAVISGKARIAACHILDKAKVDGEGNVNQSFLKDSATVTDSVLIAAGCFIEGNSKLSGRLVILPESHLRDERIRGGYSSHGSDIPQAEHHLADGVVPVRVDATRPHSPNFTYGDVPADPHKSMSRWALKSRQGSQEADSFAEAQEEYDFLRAKLELEREAMQEGLLHAEMTLEEKEKMIASLQKQLAPVDDEVTGLMEIIDDIEKSYNSYTTDVVKLIQYPLMSDLTIPEVQEFVLCLRKAKRVALSKNPSKISPEVDNLERTFIKAENVVLTARQTTLPEDKRKRLKNAEQMFNKLLDNATPAPEKKLSLRAGMKSLEGVVHVSDEAVIALKEKAGLLEIEA